MLNIPLYNQLTDTLPDGQPDPYASTDCGSECVAMVADAFGYGGVPGFSAGQIRVIIRRGDLQGTGLTTADDLVYGLWQTAQLPAHSRSVAYSVMQIEVKRAIDARIPCIVLGTWDSDWTLHWMVPIEYDDFGWTANDPWGGSQHQMSWGFVTIHYAGSYVHLDRSLP